MKLVEKKCPNCGAGLKFDDGATSVMCEYCNKTYYIQRDEKKYAKVDSAHIGDAYKFVDEYGKPIAKAFATVQILMFFVPIAIVFVAVSIIGSVIFHLSKIPMNDGSSMGDNNTFIEEKEEDLQKEKDKAFQEARKKIVTKLEQIDATSLETFYDRAVMELDSKDGSNNKYKISSDWKAYGAYLLVGKETNENQLYVLCKHTYKHKTKGNEITLYGAVKYEDLKLTSDGIVNNDFYAWAEAPNIDLNGDQFEWAFGYSSEKMLYNTLIRGQSGTYTIEASKGIYVES